jgi:hypothetical protein
MREERVADHKQDCSTHNIERSHCEPKDSQQLKVVLHSIRRVRNRWNHADNLFATLAAKRLPGLNRSAASIAEHRSPPEYVGIPHTTNIS